MNLTHRRILITAGPTWVPIDRVRVISNTASAATGIMLAERLARKNAHVTVLLGPIGACGLNKKIRTLRFTFFDELKKLLFRELTRFHYDIVVHSAAVSDYRLKKIAPKKLSSSRKLLRLQLVPTEKIIDRIKKWAPSTRLVGFKYEPDAKKAKLLKKSSCLFKKSCCDLVVANTSGGKSYTAYILKGPQQVVNTVQNKQELVSELIQYIGKNSKIE